MNVKHTGSADVMEQPSLTILDHPTSAPAIFTPEALVTAVRAERGLTSDSIPEVCVLDFDGDLTDSLESKGTASVCRAWACFHTTMFSVEVDGVSFGLVARTIGGPYAVLVAEQLLASGAKVILGLTSAGRVNPKLSIPSIVVATDAIRDEGTSYHYLSPGNFVSGDLRLANSLLKELRELAIPVTTGSLWTTDAPYRETEEQLAQHAAAGVSAVEMQAASLFAFAVARGAVVGIVAHVTNAVDHPGQPFDKGTDVSCEIILKAMCRAGRNYLASRSEFVVS